MTNLCGNKLEITGENSDQVNEYFVQMGYDSRPFYSIQVESDGIYFDSRWTPPLQELQEIAETFDVDLKLIYQLPNERRQERFDYTCLKNRKLDGPARELREMVFNAKSIQELEKASDSIEQNGRQSVISTNEWTILSYLAEKKQGEISGSDEQLDRDIFSRRSRLGR